MAVRTNLLGGTRSGESTEEAKGWINPGLKEILELKSSHW
jgi:hypothetical protein